MFSCVLYPTIYRCSSRFSVLQSPEIKKIPDADKPYEPFTDADEPKRKQRLDQIATFYGNYNIIRGNQDNSTTKAIGDINSQIVSEVIVCL